MNACCTARMPSCIVIGDAGRLSSSSSSRGSDRRLGGGRTTGGFDRPVRRPHVDVLDDDRTAVARLDEHAASGVLQRDRAGLRHLLHEVAEAARAVLALGERRVELQQRALEQAELRRDLALGQHLQRAHDERQRLGDVARADRPAAALGGRAACCATRFS